MDGEEDHHWKNKHKNKNKNKNKTKGEGSNSNSNSNDRGENKSNDNDNDDSEDELEIEWEYIYDDEFRINKNDGLVFTPGSSNYLMLENWGDLPLLKWKYLEKNTIDLKVKLPFIWRDKLHLYTEASVDSRHNPNFDTGVLPMNNFGGGKNNKFDVLWGTIDLIKEPNIREKFEQLRKEMENCTTNNLCKFVNEFIIECEWDFRENTWNLIQNRPDKNTPNFITVCSDTLRVMMDNVTMEELQGALDTQGDIVSQRQEQLALMGHSGEGHGGHRGHGGAHGGGHGGGYHHQNHNHNHNHNGRHHGNGHGYNGGGGGGRNGYHNNHNNHHNNHGRGNYRGGRRGGRGRGYNNRNGGGHGNYDNRGSGGRNGYNNRNGGY